MIVAVTEHSVDRTWGARVGRLGVEAGASPIAAPLGLYETTVPADWLDYNGHMSEWCYLLLVGLAADAFFRFIGIDDLYVAGCN
jgi:hypothetical protein